MRDDFNPLLGRETDEEFRFHLEAHARQLEREGLSPAEASAEARRRFGDLERARRESIRLDRRERRYWRFDVRQLIFAVRMLRRTPFVTAVAVLSLGLGIGANTAIFSLFNEVLMRPLPVTSPDRLVNIGSPGEKRGWTSSNNSGDSDWVFSYPMYRDLSADPGMFTGIAAQRGFRATVESRGATRSTDGVEVSGNYFAVLGLRPALGRLIGPADTAAAGGEPVVVLSHDYWRTSFESASDVIGKPLIVNGQTLAIIGVAPEGFAGTTRGTLATVFVPITMRALLEPPFDGFDDRDNYWAYLFGRLQPGVTIEAAESALDGRYHSILRAAETARDQQAGETPAFESTTAIVIEDGRRGQSYVFAAAAAPLTILQIVTAVVLLIACANVANLLLARSAGRAGEMAVRLSIGASRGRLVRQLLLESCLLGVLGGLVGLLFFQWAVALAAAQLPFGALGRVSEISISVLVFTAALSLAVGLLFGLFPALHATRPELASALKGQAGQPAGARSAARFRTGLIAVQIALSMGLLATAGLFTRSLLNMSRVDLGIEVDGLVTFRLDPQRIGYEPIRAQRVFEDVMARLRSVPGVVDVAAARVPLISNSSSGSNITVEGYTPPAGDEPRALFNEISPGFFRTVGMEIISGRDFTDADRAGGPRVAVVNETFAHAFGLGDNPVGRRMRRGGGELDTEIIGLARDARYVRVRENDRPMVFRPYLQDDEIAAMAFYARTTGDAEALRSSIRPVVAVIDPDVPVQRVYTMAEQVSQNLSEDRMLTVLSASFAGLATILAAIGLYGVLAFTVSQRTREFGLRLALGASPGAVQRLVLRQVVWLVAIGGGAGLAIAVGVGRYAQGTLFNMSAVDPAALTASATVLALVALAAAFVPSRRAARVDPMRALRWE